MKVRCGPAVQGDQATQDGHKGLRTSSQTVSLRRLRNAAVRGFVNKQGADYVPQPKLHLDMNPKGKPNRDESGVVARVKKLAYGELREKRS